MNYFSIRNIIGGFLFLAVMALMAVNAQYAFKHREHTLDHIDAIRSTLMQLDNTMLAAVSTGRDNTEKLALLNARLQEHFNTLKALTTEENQHFEEVGIKLDEISQLLSQKLESIRQLEGYSLALNHARTSLAELIRQERPKANRASVSKIDKVEALLNAAIALHRTSELTRRKVDHIAKFIVTEIKLKGTSHEQSILLSGLLKDLDVLRTYYKSQRVVSENAAILSAKLAVLEKVYQKRARYQDNRMMLYQVLLYISISVFLLYFLFLYVFSNSAILSMFNEIGRRKSTEEQLLLTQDELKSELERRDAELEKEQRATQNALEAKIVLESQLTHSQQLNAIGTLVGGVAHDFNNLLSAILGYTDLLKTVVTDDGCDAWLVNIMVAAERAADLTRQLLCAAKKEVGPRRAFNVNEVMVQTISLLSRTVNNDIVLVKDLIERELVIHGDASMISQVLMNLAVNAKDAIEGEGEISFKTELIQLGREDEATFNYDISPGEYVKITIKDTGCGISEELKEKVFSPYFTTKGKDKGTGLGLAIAKDAIKEHDGFIRCESNVGLGTKFEVYLPLASELKIAFDEKKSFLLEEDVKNMSVLVIDDEPMFLDLMFQIFKKYTNAKVYLAQSSEEGLNIYRKHQDEIDLVLLDIVMPKVDGLVTYQSIKAMDKTANILLASGYPSTQELERIREQHEVELILKPFTAITILSRMNELFSKRRKYD